MKCVNLSYIYLGSSVCHPVCRPVIFLSSCHSCGTLSYSLCFSNPADKGNETEGFEREGYRWRDRKGTDRRGRVWRDFSLYKLNLINMTVHRATCSCSVELYKQWSPLADFFPNWNFCGVFSTYICIIYSISLVGSAQLWWQGTLYFLASLVQWDIIRVILYIKASVVHGPVDRHTPLTTRVRALREAFCFWKFCEVFSVYCVGRISEAAIGGPRSSFRVRLSSVGCSVAQKGAA